MVPEEIFRQAKSKIFTDRIGKLPQKHLSSAIERDRLIKQLAIDDTAHLELIIDKQEISDRDLRAVNRKLQTGAEQMQLERDLARAIVAAVWQPLLVLNHQLRIVTANRSFYQLFEVLPTEMEGQLFANLHNGQWQIPELHSRLEELVINNVQFGDFEVVCMLAGAGLKTMRLNARQIATSGVTQAILLQIAEVAAL